MNKDEAHLVKTISKSNVKTDPTWIRYKYFKKYCKNKIVTDVGCGGGNGAYLISAVAKKVYALDANADYIKFCQRYWKNENVEHSVYDIMSGEKFNKSDVIIMSEVIEHLKQPFEKTIDLLLDHLNTNGYLCLTFPEDQKKKMGYHKIAIKRIDVCTYLIAKGLGIIEELDYMNTGKSSLVIAQKNKKMIYYVDIDDTICKTNKELLVLSVDPDYMKATPISENINKINKLHGEGNTIVYYTSRGGTTGKDWKELTKAQLKSWDCKYTILDLTKPYFDFIIDDKTLNINEI